MTAFCADRHGATSPSVFAGLAVMCALTLITLHRGARPGVPRAKQVAAVVGLSRPADLPPDPCFGAPPPALRDQQDIPESFFNILPSWSLRSARSS